MGIEKIPRGLDRCFMWLTKDLGPSAAASNLCCEVKEDGDQSMLDWVCVGPAVKFKIFAQFMGAVSGNFPL